MIKKLNNTLAILTKIKSPLKIIENVNLPNLKKNQVLVKIKDTAICGSQLFEIEGKRESKKYIPHALGHEATGVVIKKHKNIKKGKSKIKFLYLGLNLEVRMLKHLCISFQDPTKK